MDKKICVYAICKNESKFVERWYNSMKEADYVVVLDTGSTDDTVEELKRVGVDVVETKVIDPWRFDVARNESLKLIPEEYNILVCTDLDEVFEEGWADKVREAWDDSVERIEYKYSWSHYETGAPNQSFIYNKIHSRKWVWKAPVHEFLARDNSEKYTKEECKSLFTEVHLHHYPDPTKSRSSYLDLLKLRYEEDPSDQMGRLYLAREYYLHSKVPEALSMFNQIIDDGLKQKDVENGFYSNKIIIAYCYYILGQCYRMQMNQEKDYAVKDSCMLHAVNAFERGIRYDPEYFSNYLGQAYVYNEINNPKLSLVVMKQGLKNAKRQYHWLEDGSVWTFQLFNNLAVAHNRIGNKVEAIGFATLAMKLAPNDPMIKNNYNVCVNDKIQLKDLL